MKICKSNALRLWDAYYGNVRFAEDFHGNLMCRDGYGNADYCVIRWGRTVYCGWNIHHILPIACGGTNEKQNLICTNIYTNDMRKIKLHIGLMIACIRFNAYMVHENMKLLN